MSRRNRLTSAPSRWRRLLTAVAISAIATTGVVFGVSTPASAHGQFISSDPANGAEVSTGPASIVVYFSEKPTSNAYFAVTAPSGTRVDRLWSHGNSRRLDTPVHEWYHNEDGEWETRAYSVAYPALVPIAYWPETGLYTVTYLSVATDGEPVRGEFTFTYTGPTATIPADFRPQKAEPDPNLLAAAATDAPTAPPSALPIEEQVGRRAGRARPVDPLGPGRTGVDRGGGDLPVLAPATGTGAPARRVTLRWPVRRPVESSEAAAASGQAAGAPPQQTSGAATGGAVERRHRRSPEGLTPADRNRLSAPSRYARLWA